MAKKFMYVCFAAWALAILFIPSASMCGDYFDRSSDTREIRIRSGSIFRRNNWSAFMGDLKLSEEEFFYIVGDLDWAAEARGAHEDSRSVYRLGAMLFCTAVIWQLYNQQDEIKTWEEYDKKCREAKVTFALSIAGPAVVLVNWMFKAANHAPMEVAIRAAEEHNHGLRDD